MDPGFMMNKLRDVFIVEGADSSSTTLTTGASSANISATAVSILAAICSLLTSRFGRNFGSKSFRLTMVLLNSAANFSDVV